MRASVKIGGVEMAGAAGADSGKDDLFEKDFFANSEFKFTASACECLVDKTHPAKGVVKHTFRLYHKEGKINYAYMAGTGLISKKYGGSGDDRAVLPDLMVIKEGDAEAVQAFIERHGFLFPLSPGWDLSIESDDLFGLIYRLQATVELLTALGDVKTDYKRILALTLYLLLTPQINFDAQSYGSFHSCNHVMSQVWNGTYQVDENANSDLGFRNSHPADYLIDGCPMNGIKDSIYPPNTTMSFEEYTDIMISYEEINPSSMINKTAYLFVSTTPVNYYCRLAIDLLYHICKDVREIKSWNHKGELTFMESPKGEPLNFKGKFCKELQDGLLKLAKHTLKTEIEYNLSNVTPLYDTETMAPSWRIKYLISGLYFSVFYMRPKIELYRTCLNPNCRRPFLVKTTSTKQKYCNRKCANSMAQRNYKRREKEKSA